jgi:hypothetical protein
MHQSCVKICTIFKWTETSFHLSLVTLEYHWVRPKWFEPMVCLAQTAHLSCSDTNTVSKRTGTRFHMSHVTYEFHRVRSKRYPSLWNIRRKPYSYLASRLVLYENRSKWVSTWAMSPRRTSSVSKWFLGLAKTVHLSYTNPNTVSKWTKMRIDTTHIT